MPHCRTNAARVTRTAMIVSTAALAVLLAPALAAGSPTPVTIGTGTNAAVAVAPDGTADIVYETPPPPMSSTQGISYCRLPADAGACAATIALTVPNNGSGITNLNVFAPSATTVEIYAKVQDCQASPSTLNDYVEYLSTNGGQTFAAHCRNSAATWGGTGQGYLQFNGQFVTAGGDGSADVGFETTLPAGTADGTAAATAIFNPTALSGGDVQGSIDMTGDGPGGHLVAAGALENGGNIRYSVYTGTAPGSATDQNTSANWHRDLPLIGNPDTYSSSAPLLLGGSEGIYMAYLEDASSTTRGVQFLPLNGVGNLASFQAPTPTPALGGGEQPFDLAATEATNGDQIVTFIDANGNLRYSSRTTGHGLSEQGTIVNIPGSYTGQQLAAAADRNGVDVWDDDTHVFAVALTPTPDPPPVLAVVPPGVIAPPNINIAPPPDPFAKSPGSAPNAPAHTTTVKNPDGSSFALGVPKACVAPGSTFSVTLGFSKTHKKPSKRFHGTVYVKVTKVAFSVAGSTVKTDKKAPFKQTLTIKASTKKGSSVLVRARASMKVKHGPEPTKSITTKVKVCAA
jgi:hypothetical protein